MKKLILVLSFISITIPLFAQDDCDASSSMDDVWMGKRTELGPNCMQYAINLSMNTNHNRGLALSDGTFIPVYAAERIESPLPGGAWKVLFQDSQGWELTENERMIVFKRPGSIMNLGPLINMEFYTLDLDTGITKVDISKILKTVIDDMDKYEDELDVKVEPYYEEGKLYCKISGNINIGEGLKPTSAGDMIAYFFMSICYTINYNIKYEELEAVKKIGNTKLDYWSRTALSAALQARPYINYQSTLKDGQMNWSEQDGKKGIQIENYGTYMIAQIRIDNTTDANRQSVTDKLNEWLKKNKHKYVESAETKIYGNTPWVGLKFNISGKTGNDIYEDYYEDVIRDWSDDVLEEAEDLIND